MNLTEYRNSMFEICDELSNSFKMFEELKDHPKYKDNEYIKGFLEGKESIVTLLGNRLQTLDWNIKQEDLDELIEEQTETM